MQNNDIPISVKKSSSDDDLLTGHSAVDKSVSRNIITTENFVGTEIDFHQFLINTCALDEDTACFDEMVDVYDMFGVKSWQVQARAIYWNSKIFIFLSIT